MKKLANIYSKMTPQDVPNRGDRVLYSHHSETDEGYERVVSGAAKVTNVEWVKGGGAAWVDITVKYDSGAQEYFQARVFE